MLLSLHLDQKARQDHEEKHGMSPHSRNYLTTTWNGADMAYAPAGAARPRMSPSAAAQRSNGGSRNGRKAAVAAEPGRKTSTTFLAGLGVGLALGAAVALLLAPRTGAATREAIRNRGRRARNKAS